MSSTSDAGAAGLSVSRPPATTRGIAAWPWIALAGALVWEVLVRIPLVLNAPVHLDSDLAVDGLTLLEAVRGRWRWHYPGTPYMGTLPVLLSWPQALIWGANPATLVSGGAVAWCLLTIGVFVLARRAFGAGAAVASLVPLAFCSTGALWLSGRITGGHVLTAAWHAGAFAWLHAALTSGGRRAAAGLGVWCGLGLWLDSMFLVTLAGLLPAAAGCWLERIAVGLCTPRGPTPPGPPFLRGGAKEGEPPSGATRRGAEQANSPPCKGGARGGRAARVDRTCAVQAFGALAWGAPRSALAGAAAFALGFVVGLAPREIGRRVDPYDAYPAQFALARERSVLEGHAGLLVRECLPRLIAGHRLPQYQSDPNPRALGGGAPLGTARQATLLAVATTWTALALGLVSYCALAASASRPGDAARRAVAAGLLLSAAAVVVGFIVNENIYNADNYRYLVTLLVPGAVGFGVAAAWACRRDPGTQVVAVLTVAATALLMTADTARWYARLGWLDARGRPVRRPLDYPALDWLAAHPEVRAVYAGYWDVYRLAFLTGGRVRGKPFTMFPNRFPEWTPGGPEAHPKITLVSAGPGSAAYTHEALRAGAHVVGRQRGVLVLRWPEAEMPAPREPEKPPS